MHFRCRTTEITQVSHADCLLSYQIITSHSRVFHRGGENSIADSRLHRTLLNFMKHNHEGIYGLYRRLTPMILRNILPYALFIVFYGSTTDIAEAISLVRAIRTQSAGDNNTLELKLDTLLTSVATLLASVLSWSLITPLDVVETVMLNCILTSTGTCFNYCGR